MAAFNLNGKQALHREAETLENICLFLSAIFPCSLNTGLSHMGTTQCTHFKKTFSLPFFFQQQIVGAPFSALIFKVSE